MFWHLWGFQESKSELLVARIGGIFTAVLCNGQNSNSNKIHLFCHLGLWSQWRSHSQIVCMTLWGPVKAWRENKRVKGKSCEFPYVPFSFGNIYNFTEFQCHTGVKNWEEWTHQISYQTSLYPWYYFLALP